MRIIQITDLHINADGEEARKGVKTRTNCKRILADLTCEQYDLLVFTGDFCLDMPCRSIYRWFAHELITASIDKSILRLIPGNHDDSAMMVAEMGELLDLDHRPLIGQELYFMEWVERRAILYLDTSKGYSSNIQKSWLAEQIEAIDVDLIIVFMHHPPLLADVRIMDERHSLQDMAEFQRIFTSFPNKRFLIFCGHYHVDRQVSWQNMDVFITPSCYAQIDPDADRFVVDHLDIGYQIIDLHDDGRVVSRVKYLSS